MADISRWGSRFEEAMNRPEAEPPTLSELITQMANEAEVDEIGTQIGTWVLQRLGHLYEGCRITVEYDAPCAWYEVRVDYSFRGVMASAVVKIRDEDVDEYTQGTAMWSRYMNQRTYELRRSIQKSLLAGGVKAGDIVRAHQEPMVSLNTAAETFRTMGLQAEDAARAMQNLFPHRMDYLEEKEAIESIKRTIEAQQREA